MANVDLPYVITVN